MARDDDVSQRPERVVIVDADDPMREIHGRFVWADEHERVVDEVRRRAFAEGFEAGLRDRPSKPVEIRLRRRRTAWSYVTMAVLIMLGLLLLLMLPVVLT